MVWYDVERMPADQLAVTDWFKTFVWVEFPIFHWLTVTIRVYVCKKTFLFKIL